METLNLILLLLFISFILVPALIYLAMLGIAASVVETAKPIQVIYQESSPPPKAPINLKPPKTLKYVCPESNVCNWQTNQNSDRTCVAKKTDKCTYEYIKEECKKIKDILEKRQDYSHRSVSFKASGIGDELICNYDYDRVLVGSIKCIWSDPKPDGSIQVIEGNSCTAVDASEYCESKGGVVDQNTVMDASIGRGLVCKLPR